MKKILILGSSGFIGKNICQYFKNKNIQVFGTYLNNKPKNEDGIKYVKADLTKKKHAMKVIRGKDIIIQAAAITGGIKDAKKNPVKYISDNAVMNSIIFETVFKCKTKHFIFLSCSVMYHVSKNALKEIAQKAISKKTGARGLRSILENILLKTMFDLPGQDNIEEVIIDSGSVKGVSQPIIVHSKNKIKTDKTSAA